MPPVTLEESRTYVFLRQCGEGWHTVDDVLSQYRKSPDTVRSKISARLHTLADRGLVERRKEHFNERSYARRRWQYRDLNPEGVIKVIGQKRSRWSKEDLNEEYKNIPSPTVGSQYMVTYMESVLDFHDWCSENGLDFKQQMSAAMGDHITKHKGK